MDSDLGMLYALFIIIAALICFVFVTSPDKNDYACERICNTCYDNSTFRIESSRSKNYLHFLFTVDDKCTCFAYSCVHPDSVTGCIYEQSKTFEIK